MSDISTTSRFYRNAPQLRRLLYLIRDRLEKVDRIKLIHFGVSRGEEAYTMRMVTLDIGCNPDRVSIYGYDINKDCILGANKGRYEEESFSFGGKRFIPERALNRYFSKDGETLLIHPAIIHSCKMSYGDILNPPNNTGDFVFLQNVTCHMHSLDAETAINNVYQLTNSNGYMILGGYDESREDCLNRMYKDKMILPVITDLHTIHNAWTDRIEYSDTDRPPWMLGPIEDIPNSNLLYSSIFRKIGL
jgi:chemotaxis methyl-accepting protein methylase